ncbi:hypothetical protein CEXT_140281 [Caerostris extrusa]|uniref:Uncharacterized protein n=1 Tax=Caerostris extrusa TaxID=172846 RepID=A0AAV4XQA8_CAEEX|nr:hypothetical protein CEXT_140281 [Caerostris extrusa]
MQRAGVPSPGRSRMPLAGEDPPVLVMCAVHPFLIFGLVPIGIWQPRHPLGFLELDNPRVQTVVQKSSATYPHLVAEERFIYLKADISLFPTEI